MEKEIRLLETIGGIAGEGYITVRVEGQRGNYNCVLLTNDVV